MEVFHLAAADTGCLLSQTFHLIFEVVVMNKAVFFVLPLIWYHLAQRSCDFGVKKKSMNPYLHILSALVKAFLGSCNLFLRYVQSTYGFKAHCMLCFFCSFSWCHNERPARFHERECCGSGRSQVRHSKMFVKSWLLHCYCFSGLVVTEKLPSCLFQQHYTKYTGWLSFQKLKQLRSNPQRRSCHRRGERSLIIKEQADSRFARKSLIN